MLKTSYPWSLDSLSRDGLRALIDSAGRLKRAAATDAGLPQLLRGRRLALLSDDHDSPAAAAFTMAATELGGHVARVRASNPGEARRDPRDMAALLGQLYDAIECQGLPEAELRQLGRDAGVPVFDAIGDPAHPLNLLAQLMIELEDGGRLDGPAPAADGTAADPALARLGERLGLPPAGTAPAGQDLAERRARNRHHLLQAVLSESLS